MPTYTEQEESEIVELFMLNEDDRDERLKAHYRQGKIVDGKWVNDEDEEEIEGEIILIGREYLKEIEEEALSYWIEYNHKGLKIDGGYIEEEWLDE